jgi:CRP-like cAMP-binding protein
MIFRHLAAAGLELASPANTPYPVNETAKKAFTQTERSLELVEIFRNLTTTDRGAVAAKVKQHSYERGEVLLEPGTVLQSLFIVASGVLSLAHDGAELKIELLRLGPGDHFGEVGMLTGAPSIARITALTPAIVYELAKTDLAPILEARPDVSQEICRALAQRQALGRSIATAEVDRTIPINRLTSWFSEQFRKLLEDLD